MNALIVGINKKILLEHLPDPFLLIDDGDLIDQIELPKRRAVTRFDISHHSFNPVKGIDYRRAREFVAVLDAVFPEGDGTLTRKNSNFILLTALLNRPRTLDTLIPPPPKGDSAHLDAYQKIQTLLFSPVLKAVLTRPTNVSFKGIILARLDRAALGDFDSFVLGNLLMSQYAGPVVVPDFGFYARQGHANLIRQNRLVAGVNALAELPGLRNALLTIDTKIASHSTADDAKVLAQYAGLLPATNAFNQFVETAIA